MLGAELRHFLSLRRKIRDLGIQQRNAFIGQLLLQAIEMGVKKRGLARRHGVLVPLLRRSDEKRQHAGMFVAAGGSKRQVVVDAQIGAKPDQMGGHNTPVLSSVTSTSHRGYFALTSVAILE
ncbi:hypothetical protein D3C76_1331350 [compost metagenome]